MPIKKILIKLEPRIVFKVKTKIIKQKINFISLCLEKKDLINKIANIIAKGILKKKYIISEI